MTEIGVYRQGEGEQISANPLPAEAGRGFPLALLATVARRVMFVMMACFGVVLSLVVVPTLLGYPALTVQGGSMADSLSDGSVAITRWVPADEVEAGDVIVISHADAAPIIHRVVSIVEQDGAFVVETKGDANRAADPGYSVLTGRVAVHFYTIPYLGYAADFLRTPLGWTLFVLLPIGLLCFRTLRDMWLVDDKPAAVLKTAHEPRRPPAPLLLPVARAARSAMLAGLVVLAVGLADSDDSSLAGDGAATPSEPSTATAPLVSWDGTGWEFDLAGPKSGGGGMGIGWSNW